MAFRNQEEALRAQLELITEERDQLRSVSDDNAGLRREVEELKGLISKMNADNVEAIRDANDKITQWEERAKGRYLGGPFMQHKQIFIWVLLVAAFSAIWHVIR